MRQGFCSSCGVRLSDLATPAPPNRPSRHLVAGLALGFGASLLLAVAAIAGWIPTRANEPIASPPSAEVRVQDDVSQTPGGPSLGTAGNQANQELPTGESQSAAPPGPLDAFVGEWIGTVTQEGSSSYTVRLSLREAGNSLVGTSVYPELGNCRGDLVNPRLENSALLIDEVIVEGRSHCVNLVQLRLERSGEFLRYSFDDAYRGSALLTSETP